VTVWEKLGKKNPSRSTVGGRGDVWQKGESLCQRMFKDGKRKGKKPSLPGGKGHSGKVGMAHIKQTGGGNGGNKCGTNLTCSSPVEICLDPFMGGRKKRIEKEKRGHSAYPKRGGDRGVYISYKGIRR